MNQKAIKFQNTERNKANVARMMGYQLNFNRKVFEALKATKLKIDFRTFGSFGSKTILIVRYMREKEKIIMKETERAMKEVHKFLQENVTENMSMDEINALLQAHLKEINANIPKGITEETAETADDFMELAEQKYKDGDEMGALRLARKAQKIDPDNLDIDLFLLAGEKGSVDKTLRKFQKILEKGKTILEKQGCFQEDVGHFW